MNVLKDDCVIALSFGRASEKTQYDINKGIADIAKAFALPIFTQEDVAKYISNPVFIAKSNHGYIDTWSVLALAKSQMKKEGYARAIIVAHRAHITRATVQAKKQNITFSISHRLPSTWDKHSLQWWTRSKFLWQIHELYAIPKLRLVGKM